MTALPPPPVPLEADLTHFDNMPLEVRRLRDSGLAGVEDGEIFRCAVLLWCAAWHQLPAGSLPDADAELCRLVGLGRDLRTWRRLRPDVLRGWRRFADGRLYHPVVSEKVIASWNSTLRERWRRACDRLRKENKGRKANGGYELAPPPEPALVALAWPADGVPLSAGIPPETELKGIEEKKNREVKGRDHSEAASSPADGPPAGGPAGEAAALAAWQEFARQHGCHEVHVVTGSRRARLQTILTMCGGPEGLAAALAHAAGLDFLRGIDGRLHGWFTFDWLLEPANFTRLQQETVASCIAAVTRARTFRLPWGEPGPGRAS